MTLMQALGAHLSADSGVAAIAEDRVYPVFSPQIETTEEIQPLVVFTQTSRAIESDLGGSAAMDKTAWLINCIAQSADSAHELADAVVACLANFYGTLGGSGGVAGVYCQLTDSYDEQIAAEQGIGSVSVELSITRPVS